MTANEIRELEDMNPAEGGDELLVNGNMIPIDQAGAEPEPPALPQPKTVVEEVEEETQ
jgi:hypothetical protein